METSYIQPRARINEFKIKAAAEIIRALAHPLRLKIIQYLDTNAGVSVRSIYADLGIEQSVASQHLKILREAQIINPMRQGKFIFYTVNYNQVEKVNKIMCTFFEPKVQ